MKRILLYALLCSSIAVYGQRPGEAGTLLRNEMRHNARIPNNNYGNHYNQQSHPNQVENYQWHTHNDFAEVFIRILERGAFKIVLGNQSIENSNGKFRFFDLPDRSTDIAIYENGNLIYRARLGVKKNTRLILDFFVNRGLYLLSSKHLSRNYYNFENWDDVWNTPYQNHPHIYSHNNNQEDRQHNSPNYNTQPTVMDNTHFYQFVEKVKTQESFDKGKIEMIGQQTTYYNFTALQIKTLMNTLSFDSYKVQLGKLLFPICVDKQNFYEVYDALTFDSYKSQLRKAVETRK